MMGIILKILSVLGILLLVLLLLALAALLLVLFFPVVYRIEGRREPAAAGQEESFAMAASVKADWLFGMLRLRYAYPDPGKVTLKLLWMTLLDSSTEKGSVEKASMEKAESLGNEEEHGPEETIPEEASRQEPAKEGNSSFAAGSNGSPGDDSQGNASHGTRDLGQEDENAAGGEKFSKFDKIKYTFQKIYVKIKKMWENISFYVRLLQEEDTKALFGHACTRLGRILKCIRPRRLKADVLFGTGAPDTTGYLTGFYAALSYGMLLPALGNSKHYSINITPDFERAILQGWIYAAGHITIAKAVWQALLLVKDRKLHRLLHKLKAHRK